jgi:S1-C subfamily serine protease
MRFIYLVLISLLLTILACVTTLYPKKLRDYNEVTALVIDSAQSGGGTAVLFRSSKAGSIFLTNKHVCLNLLEGATVYLRGGKYKVKELLFFKEHDLCAIKIRENLKTNISLAEEAPEELDKVTVIGYPLLKGPIVEEGYVIKTNMFITVPPLPFCESEGLVSIRCEKSFKELEIYPTTFVKALITFGSSGSPTFNSSGELVGLVMAKENDQGFGYAYAVPLKFIKAFVAQLETKQFILIPEVTK